MQTQQRDDPLTLHLRTSQTMQGSVKTKKMSHKHFGVVTARLELMQLLTVYSRKLWFCVRNVKAFSDWPDSVSRGGVQRRPGGLYVIPKLFVYNTVCYFVLCAYLVEWRTEKDCCGFLMSHYSWITHLQTQLQCRKHQRYVNCKWIKMRKGQE